jgi:hypothetical protein
VCHKPRQRLLPVDTPLVADKAAAEIVAKSIAMYQRRRRATIKSLLDLGAKAAIMYDPELKLFYNRKVLSGKHPKCVRNIIRGKLVSRMFAVINKQCEYQKNFVNNLVI